MVYLRTLLTWSQRLTKNKKKTLKIAFLLCALFQSLAGITQPAYSLSIEYPYYIELIFIIFQICSLVCTIYFLSLVEIAAVNRTKSFKSNNKFITKVVTVAVPILLTILALDAALFIRGIISGLTYQITNPSGKGVGYILLSTMLNGLKSMTLDNYISRVFQLGDVTKNVFINVLDHVVRYIEPGFIIFNICYIFANPLSKLTDNDWMKSISCNPQLVRKMELDHQEINMRLQNVFVIEVDSVKHQVALIVKDMKYRTKDIVLLICTAILSILSLLVGLKHTDSLILMLIISIIHPVIFMFMCWCIMGARKESAGTPMLYEVESFSKDYRVMKLKELQFQYSQKDVKNCFRSFKNENVIYMRENGYHSESDAAYKNPWMIMAVFLIINVLMINTLPSWLYVMPIGIGDLLLFNDVMHRSTRPDAVGFVKRYVIYTLFIYAVLLCTKFF